jgi:hypothetical protein
MIATELLSIYFVWEKYAEAMDYARCKVQSTRKGVAEEQLS